MIKRLILGCGKHYTKQEGDLTLDVRPFEGVDIVCDLNLQTWGDFNNPFEDNKFDAIVANHVIEHLNNLVNFMDECWRILKPGGSLYLTTPLAGVNPDLEWADPTHKRCFRLHTFVNYFSIEGVEAFGYTDKAWNFFVTRIKNGDTIEIHTYPIKLG